MAKYLTEQEAREKMVDRLRTHDACGGDKAKAEKLADTVVGSAFDNYARRAGNPPEKRR